jgi:hypothetical protein
LSLALTFPETGASDLLNLPKNKSSKSGQKWLIFGPKSFLGFLAEASGRGWEPLLGIFAAHNMHMLLLKTNPIWVKFSEATERQSQKRAIFHLKKKK